MGRSRRAQGRRRLTASSIPGQDFFPSLPPPNYSCYADRTVPTAAWVSIGSATGRPMPAPVTNDELLDLGAQERRTGREAPRRLPGQGHGVERHSAGAGQVRRPHGPRRRADPLPGRTVLPGQVAPLHHRPLQGAGTPRRRRHGQRLPLRTQADAAQGGRQGAAHRQGRRPRLAGALLPRGPRRRRPRSPQHRPRLRHRPGRQAALPRHGVRGRRQPPGDRQAQRPHGRDAGGPLHPPGGSGHPARPRDGRPGPPRHQAGQHPRRPQRHRQDPRHGPGPLLPRRRTTSSPRSTTKTSSARPTTWPRNRPSTATAWTSGPTSTASGRRSISS